MGNIRLIAYDEWRYWRRSKLAISVLAIAFVLAVTAVIATHLSITRAAEARQALQSAAEAAFAEQPDRHPHRMVHYGHYVFRTPTPLASIDPGVDAYTGTAIFLEGHRQNSATFSPMQRGSGLNWLGMLSPAFIMQILVPLVIVLIGFASVSREKESGTFTYLQVQGTSVTTLLLGKGLALLSVAGLLLLPLLVSSLLTVFQGEALSVSLLFVCGYAIYLSIWVLFTLFVSLVSPSNANSLSWLLVLWVVLCLLLPKIASSTATVLAPSPGKLETEFAILKALREEGDAHNANDPAFNQLKQQLLAKYKVDNIEDLPVNFKGVVAQAAEAKHTDILNDFAEQSRQDEITQASISRWFGWLSPAIAIQTASTKLAGSDLENHHRFLREAEAVRYDFVQSLNKMHAEDVSYHDDSNKYKDEDTHAKAKVDASSWQVLQSFAFSPDKAQTRIAHSLQALTQLVFLLLIALVLFVVVRRRA